MNEYKVSVKEYLERTVTIDGNSEVEAIQKAKEMYRNEEIVLSSEDFVTSEFEVETCKELEKNIVYVDVPNSINYLRDMEEKLFYAYDISGEGYADYLLLQRDKDTLWIVSAWEKENFEGDEYPLESDLVVGKQHCLVKFDTFQFLSFERFYDVYIELYEAHMGYEIRGGEPELYVVDTDLNIQELNVKVLHEQYKKQESYKVEAISK